MGIGAAIAASAATSVIGGAISAGAAGNAAQVQADAAQHAADLQYAQFQQTQNNLAPFRTAGYGALSQLQTLMQGGQNAVPGATFMSSPSQAPGLGAVPSYLPNSGDSAVYPMPGQSGGAPAAALPSLDVSKLSPDQLKAVNSELQTQVKAALKAKYGDDQNLPPGTVFGSPNSGSNDPNDTSTKWHFNPDSVSGLDISNPGWNIDNIKALAPNLDLSKVLTAAGQSPPPPPKPGEAGSPGVLGASNTGSGKSPFLSALEGVVPGGTNPFLANLETFNPNDPNANGSVKTLNALLGTGPAGSGNPAAVQAALEATPGYQFVKDQGLKATQNSFAAHGLGSSGAALKGAAQFTTGLADATYEQRVNDYLNNYNSQFTNSFNAYGQQFNNAQTAYQNQFTNTFNLATLGSNAAAQTGTLGQQAASAAGGYLTSGAAAQAGGIVGGTNALTSGINGVANSAVLYGLNKNGLFSNPSAAGPVTGNPGV